MSAATIDLLQREISNPDTQWSLGTFGAIAEFSRDRGEPVRLVQSAEAVSAVTPRGGIALKPDAAIRPYASEGITKTGWNQKIALCLPQDDCAMNQRVALTEVGPDHQAPREEDRDSILFDLGFGALQADFCVRIADRNLARRLRDHVGRAVFDHGNPAMGMILEANPHRVFISRLGRIEVYQPIPPPTGKSPEGPHTHVLPRLLKSGRTHPATEPVPDGMVPCAHLYPPHPARDGLGEARPFDAARHRAFQQMMAACGDPETSAIKQRVVEAVLAGEPPSEIVCGRNGRTGIRVALRQMKAEGLASSALGAWLASFDSASSDESDDEAALHHNG
ncbi:DUF6925 family protein [Bradyrhizobium valentinum]|uniref:Uncharacterized protein n=1 Tax=Bradyrhizobium valentinum TaxID=1518501 RepID=A0A0R3L0I0_9BRAD|nr:hypothetical protein [Bradyrhizobium valentinum]KRR01092.1 hypothetical protein CP49_05565 [Bradyrhizobium valentinum]KRR13148.1 hypothetical protein CQ10_10560 [Bradyrhizobium valentinum]